MALAMNGQSRVLASYRAAAIDAVVVLRTNTGDFGSAWFGETYAQDFMEWLGSDYDLAAEFGSGEQIRIAVYLKRGLHARQ